MPLSWKRDSEQVPIKKRKRRTNTLRGLQKSFHFGSDKLIDKSMCKKNWHQKVPSTDQNAKDLTLSPRWGSICFDIHRLKLLILSEKVKVLLTLFNKQ
jgi:hypothetical protein